MNLKHLTDQCLLSEALRLVREEREMLTVILHHLREIERRRLYSGQPSLFAYATKVLGYSEDQACRRISAMRLLKGLPELEPRLESGEINLSHFGLAQSLFTNDSKNGNELTPETKKQVLEQMVGQSFREAQRTVTRFVTAPVEVVEKVKPVGVDRNAVTLGLTDVTLAKIERVKGLLAHRAPDLALGDLIDQMCDFALEQWSPAKEPSRKMKRPTKAGVRRAVWARDRGACTSCG